jgi:hypothetical protein
LANENLQKIESDQQDDIEYKNFYPIYEESSSSEINDFDDILPIIRNFEEEEECMSFYRIFLIIFYKLLVLADEDIIPMMHTPITDDSIMKAEND